MEIITVWFSFKIHLETVETKKKTFDPVVVSMLDSHVLQMYMPKTK